MYKNFYRILLQAGTELGQAQLKLKLDFILIFCKFGFSSDGLVKLVEWI